MSMKLHGGRQLVNSPTGNAAALSADLTHYSTFTKLVCSTPIMPLGSASFRVLLVIGLLSGLLVSAEDNPTKSRATRAVSPKVADLYKEGMAALGRKALSAARQYFERIVKLTPRSPEARNLLGWVLM